METVQLDPEGGTPSNESTRGTEPKDDEIAIERSADEPEALSLDSIFDVLSNRRRRDAITYLNEHGDDPVRLRDLAEQIAAWENDISVQEVTYEERKRVYTSLYQSHLKKMNRLGIVEYDQNRGTIERTRATGQFGDYLRSIRDDDDALRAGIPVGVAVLSVAVVATAWAGFLPVLSGNGFAVAALVAGTFLAVTALDTVTDLDVVTGDRRSG